MFARFEQVMTDLTRGTVRWFSGRCHSPLGTQLKITLAASVLEAPPVRCEGVTCIACHRIPEHYSRSTAARRLASGDIYQPVGVSGNGASLWETIQRAGELKLGMHADPYHVKSFHGGPKQGEPEQVAPAQAIHESSRFFKPNKKW